MTISTSVRTAGPFAGTGIATPYPFTFKVFQAADLFVQRSDASGVPTNLVLGTDYTVTLNSDQNASPGGTLNLVVALPVASSLTFTSNVPLTQPASLTNAGGFFPSTIENALDRIVIILQQLGVLGTAQAIRVPEIGGIPVLPAVAARANQLLGFDALGNPITVGPVSGSAVALAADLANTVLLSKGSGQVGHNGALAYSATTVGGELVRLATIVLNFASTSDPVKGAALSGYNASLAYAAATVGGELVRVGGLLSNLFSSKIPARALGVPVFGSCVQDSFGDSYTAGNGSAGYNCYAAIIGSRFNNTFNNRGIGGTGVTKTLTQAWLFLPKYHMRNRLITWMAGFNDLHFNGGGTTTLQKVRECARAFMANAFLSKAWPANDTSVVTQTGAWTAATPGTWGDKASSMLTAAGGSGRALFNNVATAKLTFAFNGDSVVVGTWSNKPSTYTLSPIDIYIDGVFVENYVPNNTTDGNVGLPDTFEGLTHTARVYTGLGNGAHTIEVRVTANNYCMVDYFGTLAPPSECPSLLMAGVCHVDATGYATLETLRSVAIDDSASAVILAEVNTFVARGYPVVFVPPNDYYDPTTMIFTDHDHPAVIGHLAIANAFISRAYIAANTAPPSASLTKSATQSAATATAVAVTWSAAVDDRQGFWAAGTPSRIFAPSTGTLRLSGTVVSAVNTTGVRVCDVRKNGGALLRQLDARGGFLNNDCVQSFSVDIPVVAGDYLEVFFTQNSGGALNVQVDSQLDITMIR